MGYYLCFASCYGCGRPFGFNPHLVPSIRVDGKREPLCQSCVERANPRRMETGLPVIEILPGAYDPADELED